MSLGYQPDLPDSGAHALQSLDPDGALLMLDSEALALRKGIAPRMPKPFNSNVEKKRHKSFLLFTSCKSTHGHFWDVHVPWVVLMCMHAYSVMSDSLQLHGCSLPGPSVHGILQARILEWVAMPSSRGIFPTQGSNPCLLHWQADSLLHHLGSPSSP